MEYHKKRPERHIDKSKIKRKSSVKSKHEGVDEPVKPLITKHNLFDDSIDYVGSYLRMKFGDVFHHEYRLCHILAQSKMTITVMDEKENVIYAIGKDEAKFSKEENGIKIFEYLRNH